MDTRVVSRKYFSKLGSILGFRFQVSGVRKIQRTAHRKQRTAKKRQTVFYPQDLFADTRNLTPETTDIVLFKEYS